MNLTIHLFFLSKKIQVSREGKVGAKWQEDSHAAPNWLQWPFNLKDSKGVWAGAISRKIRPTEDKAWIFSRQIIPTQVEEEDAALGRKKVGPVMLLLLLWAREGQQKGEEEKGERWIALTLNKASSSKVKRVKGGKKGKEEEEVDSHGEKKNVLIAFVMCIIPCLVDPAFFLTAEVNNRQEIVWTSCVWENDKKETGLILGSSFANVKILLSLM